ARVQDDNASAIRGLTSKRRLPTAVAAALAGADARSWTARGRTALRAEAFGMATESFRRALTLDSRNADALRGASEAAAGAHQGAEELTWLKGLAADPSNAAVRVELSRVLASNGDFDGAIAAANEAGRIEPESPRPAEQLASIFADAGDAEQLTPLADALVARFP